MEATQTRDMIIQEPVQAAIWHCLNHYDHKGAVFLAERLCAEVETDETVYILATSYYRSNLRHQAYWLLKEKSRRSPQCRFLQAQCAYELKQYAEAESLLTNYNHGDFKDFDEVCKDFAEIACFALQLIAQICLKTERTSIASSALRKALKLNPFMWHAFALLCNMGEEVDAATTFQISSTNVFETCQSSVITNSLILYSGHNNNSGSNGSNNNSSSNNTARAMLNDSTNQLNNNSDGLSSNHISSLMCTPVVFVEQPQENHYTPHNNNNNNGSLNSSMTILRGNALGQQNLNSLNTSSLVEDSPLNNVGSDQNNDGFGNDSGGFNVEKNAITPFRRQFKYLSMMSPATPTFGVLPLSSPGSGESFTTFGNGNTDVPTTAINQPNFNMSSLTPSPQTLTEVNLEQKVVVGKRVRSTGNQVTSHGNYSRRDPSSGGHHNNNNKIAVFTQGGNITPRSPNNAATGTAKGASPQNAAVRRSTRLFSNSAYSVKENNKSPNINAKFAQPRSPPPRKTKLRIAKICLNNELIEEKTHNATEKSARKNKEKIETITSPTAGVGVHNNNRNNGGHSDPADSKVLLNNSLNNAQTLSHHLLSLKKQSADGLMALMRDLGEGYKLLAKYQCNSAIKYLESNVPKHHLCSSWVQSLIGIAQYELREYEAAVAIFKRIHEAEPYRQEHMEIYSSSLWHLQKEVELSALAQDLINQDKTSSITWCVAGNCFSLHKEHETAIKFFKRAVQVDPDFVYSYTLLGHELVLTEELDKALDYFRSAVVRDPRHYNAWFGIGTIYSKQEKYELAVLHYIKALKINPENAVILVHIGAMQCFMQRKEQALKTLNVAATLDPKNPLARFHRGSIYYSLGRHQEALRELEELKEIVPKESVVFYLIGKIHKALGNIDLALMHFSWATDLDPKGANTQIKDAFDSVTYPICCPATNTNETDGEVDPTSDRSDYSTQTPNDINYESDY